MNYDPCPNCGHDWTAHGLFIATGEKKCLSLEEDGVTYIHFFVIDEYGEEVEMVFIDEGAPDGPMLFQP